MKTGRFHLTSIYFISSLYLIIFVMNGDLVFRLLGLVSGCICRAILWVISFRMYYIFNIFDHHWTFCIVCCLALYVSRMHCSFETAKQIYPPVQIKSSEPQTNLNNHHLCIIWPNSILTLRLMLDGSLDIGWGSLLSFRAADVANRIRFIWTEPLFPASNQNSANSLCCGYIVNWYNNLNSWHDNK